MPTVQKSDDVDMMDASQPSINNNGKRLSSLDAIVKRKFNKFNPILYLR